jgi:hypothetical protein
VLWKFGKEEECKVRFKKKKKKSAREGRARLWNFEFESIRVTWLSFKVNSFNLVWYLKFPAESWLCAVIYETR